MNHPPRRRQLAPVPVIVLVLLVLLPLSGGAPVRSQGTTPPPVSRDVIDRVQQQGNARVIVGVNSPFLPEGALSDGQAVTDQRRAIDGAQDALLNNLDQQHSQLITRFDSIPFVVLRVDATGLQALQRDPTVSSITLDQLETTTLGESNAVIGAPRAWNETGFTGTGQAVVVLDTGADLDHPAFAGKIVAEGCYNTNSASSGATSQCPGGVNVTTVSGSGDDCDPFTISGCGHGTHVASTAMGNAPADSFQGVAPGASLIPMNVFTLFTDSPFTGANNCALSGRSSPCVLSYVSDQILALEQVLAWHTTNTLPVDIAAVNMSLGGSNPTSGICDVFEPARVAAVNNLRSVGIVTIASAGNTGNASNIGAPACISSVVSVGSTTDGSSGVFTTDVVSLFSNNSDILDLFAPGERVRAAYPDKSYATLQGTSMAAPHVAGAWAVLRQQNPAASIDSLLSQLQSTGKPITDTRSGANNRVKPRLQLDAAAGLAPNTPVQFSIAASGATRTDIHWRTPDTNGGVRVERRIAGGDWQTVTTTAPEAVAMIDGGLVCGATYDYRVATVNSNGVSPYTGTRSTTITPARTTTYDYTGGSLTLNNGSQRAMDITVPTGGTIVDVDLTFTGDFEDPYQIGLTLIAPNGDEVPLTQPDGRATSSAEFAATFSDEGDTRFKSATPPYTGSYWSDNPLAALDGTGAAGDWTLRVNDFYGTAGAFAGTATGFTLTLTVSDPLAPCPVATDTPTPSNTPTITPTATPTATLPPGVSPTATLPPGVSPTATLPPDVSPTATTTTTPTTGPGGTGQQVYVPMVVR